MKKFFLSVSLLLLGMTVSCTSCTKNEGNSTIPIIPTVEVVVPIPAPVTTQVFKSEDWQFSAQLDWTEIKTIEPGIEILISDKNNQGLILLARDTCEVEPQKCINSSVKTLVENGATIISTSEVIINNHHYWLITSILDNIKVFAWISIVNQEVFIFSCGADLNIDVQSVCEQASQTLVLK